jgi:hypothetical protein
MTHLDDTHSASQGAAPPGPDTLLPLVDNPDTARVFCQDFPVRDAVVRVFDRSDDPHSDDASDMYVLDVFGVSVLVRLRTTGDHPTGRPQLYIHIDNEDRQPTDLAVEVANGGETPHHI